MGITKKDSDLVKHFYTDKGDFVKSYLELKDQWFVSDLRVFRAEAEEFELEEMLKKL